MEFIDLKTQYVRIQDSIQARINTVLSHGNFIMGPEIAELEEKLSDYVDVKHCISCASGTDALLLALMSYGVKPGDAVFTTTFTFIATAEVISLLGAIPVFVDIDPLTLNIDPDKLEDAIIKLKAGKKPSSGSPLKLTRRGIIAVDIFGLPADYDAISSIAKKYGLFLIEDAAQSFGAEYGGKKACSFGDIATTSFFPAKPLGCYGDGGAIFTNDTATADTLRSLRTHGKGSDKYDNVRIGINGRLDTLQAAILLAKLELFSDEIDKRRIVADRYSKALKNIVRTQSIPPGYKSVWAQYSILTDKRDIMMKALKSCGIPTAIYYPNPLHLQKAFSYLGYQQGDLPVAESVSERIFSMPMHPYLENEIQHKIITVLKGAL